MAASPGGQCFLRMLYSSVAVVNSASEVVMWIFSGVLQSCPLAGLLFAMCFSSFLELMRALIDEGRAAACADDVGTFV